MTELAREHGTPLFVLDEADFRGRAADFATAFGDADVHYASKAFLCGQVARWIADDGLPVSVQLVGRRFDEVTLFALAAQIESVRPWADRWPEVGA